MSGRGDWISIFGLGLVWLSARILPLVKWTKEFILKVIQANLTSRDEHYGIYIFLSKKTAKLERNLKSKE